VSEIQEYVSGPGFAWRVVVAQLNTRGMHVLLAMLGLFVIASLYFVVTGPPDYVREVWWVVALFFVLLALLLGTSVLIALAMNRKHIPPGSRFTAQLRDDTLAFSGPLGTADIAYSAYRRVTRRNGFVLLRMRHSRLSTMLPAQLLSESDFSRLVARVASARVATQPAAADLPLDYWFEVDAGFVSRLTRASTRFALGQPVVIVFLVVVAIPGALGLLLIALGLLLQQDARNGLPPLAFSVAVIGALVGLIWLTLRRAHRRVYAVGSRVELGLTATGVAMRNALYRTELPYDRVRGVRRRGEFTVLLSRPGRTLIPSRLLPPEAEQRLLAAIAKA
jgi:hypothetical protein